MTWIDMEIETKYFALRVMEYARLVEAFTKPNHVWRKQIEILPFSELSDRETLKGNNMRNVNKNY